MNSMNLIMVRNLASRSGERRTSKGRARNSGGPGGGAAGVRVEPRAVDEQHELDHGAKPRESIWRTANVKRPGPEFRRAGGRSVPQRRDGDNPSRALERTRARGRGTPPRSTNHGEPDRADAAGEREPGEVDAAGHARAVRRREIPRDRRAPLRERSREQRFEAPAHRVEHLESRIELP